MSQVLDNLRNSLLSKADPAVKQKSQRFFKEPVQLYGLKNAETTQIARAHFKEIKDRDKTEIFDLCEQLFASGYLEEALVACQWSAKLHKQFEESDFKIFENWIHLYISNWAVCDTFCNHTVGAFIARFPTSTEALQKWTQSDNRWMRRGAAVSLIIPGRRGELLRDALVIADELINDPDDLVQKGVGWLLKVQSQSHEKVVFDYVMDHKAEMPRTMLRYAIEKMPQALRDQAMGKG